MAAADTIASVVIGLLILWSCIGFIRQTINILLEATPDNIDYLEVKRALEEMEHIEAVHDLHIWTITSGMPILSAHIRLASCCTDTNYWQGCINDANSILRGRFGIEHTTLQVEPYEEACDQECQTNFK
jgi:cobalt-zinc-cadmium efflux system protein